MRLLAVLRGIPRTAPAFDRPFTSAIWKTAAEGRVAVTPLGLEGDAVADCRHHGGPDQALLVYGEPAYAAWRAEGTLADTAPGSFGENLLVEALTEHDVCVGDRLAVGDVELEVTKPRQPCMTLARRHGRPTLVDEVFTNHRSGWYVRVRRPGHVGAGDTVAVLNRPNPAWSVARVQDVMREARRCPDEAAALAAVPGLAADWRERLARAAGSAALLLAAAAAPLAAQQRGPLDAAVEAAIARITPAVTAIRHDLHQHPELGNQEVRTAGLVAERLRALGLEVRTGIARTGVVGTLRGGRPGPLVAVRADMDALPVTEDTPFPFKSTVRAVYLGQDVGVSHACGHDLHVAIALGVAEALAGVRDRLPGTVQFIFQPAEEGVPPGEEGGAELMLKEGLWRSEKPVAVFGLHVNADFEVGTIAYTPGPALASADEFYVTVQGRQAHGARPDLSVDPVVTASQVVLALQTIRSRNLPPIAPSVVTVARIHGGERNNIIPAEVTLSGTVRTYDPAVQDRIEARMREVVAHTTAAAGAGHAFTYRRQYPVTVNDTALTRLSLPALRRAVGAAHVRQVEPWTGAEDFSFFARETPGFFFRVGSTKPGTVSGGHHTPTFQADDGALPVGMRAIAFAVLDHLHRAAAAHRR